MLKPLLSIVVLTGASAMTTVADEGAVDATSPSRDTASAPTSSRHVLRDAVAQETSEEIRKVVDGVIHEADIRARELAVEREPLALAMFDDEPTLELQADAEDDFGDDTTGTDPRGFGNKLMPYYRYAKSEADLEIQQFVFFGMIGFNPKFAMTYEWPLAKRIDYNDLIEPGGPGAIPPGGAPPFPSGGVPGIDLSSSGSDTGMGDLILRFFVKPDFLQGPWGWEGEANANKGWSIMPIIETTLPTATADSLGGGAWIASPGFAFVTDIPGDAPFGLGFFAMMNFVDFDLFKDSSRDSTLRIRGRWFWMQPLTKPGQNIFDGLYVLTELQPVYDFEQDHFSLWIGPEFGKIVTDGFIIYAKPGWGIAPDDEDRRFTFEVGLRYFF